MTRLTDRARTQQTSHTSATPDPSGSKAKKAAEASLDDLEARSASALKGAQPAKDEGPAPRPAGQSDGRAEAKKVREELDTWYLDDDGEEAILDELDKTSPEGFQRVLDAMGPEQCERLMGSMDAGQRDRFLDMCSSRGLVKLCPAAPLPQGPFDPPPAPRLMQNDSKNPDWLKQAIHDGNLERADSYLEEYGDYFDRWKSALHEAEPDLAKVRQIGPPSPCQLPEREPGLDLDDEKAAPWCKDWSIDRSPQDYDYKQHEVVAHVVARSQGRQVAGSLELTGSLSAEADFGTVTVGGKVSRQVSADGKTQDTVSGTVGVGAGPAGVDTTVGTGGTSQSVKLDGGAAGVSVTRDAKGSTVDASLGFVGGSVSSDGTVGAKVGKTVGFEVVGAEVELGAEVGGKVQPHIDKEKLDQALVDHGSFFETPPELKKGQRWDQLSPERQKALYDVLGWTKTEWEKKRGLQGANTRPFVG